MALSNTIIIVILVALSPTYLFYISRLPCRYEAKFFFKEDFIYTKGIRIMNFTDHTKEDCILFCTVNDNCTYFHYNRKKGECFLYNSNEYPKIQEENFKNESGWVFGSTKHDSLLVSFMLLQFHTSYFNPSRSVHPPPPLDYFFYNSRI